MNNKQIAQILNLFPVRYSPEPHGKILDAFAPKYENGICKGITIEAARIYLKYKDTARKDFISKIHDKDLKASPNFLSRIEYYHKAGIGVYYDDSPEQSDIATKLDKFLADNPSLLIAGMARHVVYIAFSDATDSNGAFSCWIFDSNFGNSRNLGSKAELLEALSVLDEFYTWMAADDKVPMLKGIHLFNPEPIFDALIFNTEATLGKKGAKYNEAALLVCAALKEDKELAKESILKIGYKNLYDEDYFRAHVDLKSLDRYLDMILDKDLQEREVSQYSQQAPKNLAELGASLMGDAWPVLVEERDDVIPMMLLNGY